MGVKRNAYRLLIGKPEAKRPLGRPRRRWMDNIKMDLGEIGWSGSVWLRIGTSEFGDEPSGSMNVEKLSSGVTTGGHSSSAQSVDRMQAFGVLNQVVCLITRLRRLKQARSCATYW
jgi:hypothetical protein